MKCKRVIVFYLAPNGLAIVIFPLWTIRECFRPCYKSVTNLIFYVKHIHQGGTG